MIESSLVEKTINSLKERLNKNEGLIEIYRGEGRVEQVKCTFNAPTSTKEIESFEKDTGFILPDDYKRFLLISNGCSLFDHPYYGGESYLYDLDTILEEYIEETHEGCFTIGYFYTENIVVNSDRYREGNKNYLMVKEKIDQFIEARDLNMNFELWLDRYVISQGRNFWKWLI